MRFARFPGDPRPVSVLAMGTHMNLGYALSDSEADALVDTAVGGGINLFDTADAYADGAAETALGRCLRRYPRESLWILTKAGAPVRTGAGLSPQHIRRQIEASLRRLQTDYVDLYLCHHDDSAASLEGIVETMSDLIVTGKVRHWGVSNWSASRVERANGIARAEGLRPMTVCQPRYSLLYRHAEHDLFPVLQKWAIGATTFSPLAHGVLAGIYRPGEPPPPGTRAAMAGENALTLELYYTDENLRRAQRLGELARDVGTSAAALATAWCAAHPAVTSVILGAWNAAEMRENLAAAELEFDSDLLAQLDALFPPDPRTEI